MGYAEYTSVPISRSQEEIKKILSKYGAQAFMMGESPDTAMIAFELKGRHIKMILPTLIYGKSKNKKNYLLSQKDVDQENRRRWRCLVIAIKAKLECVESGITTLEQEFMAHIVLPDGSTIGHLITPQIEDTYKTGNMPPLLGMRNQ
jgi:hypothetical protein